jgi:energy-converting hydrogenase Eha subunit F
MENEIYPKYPELKDEIRRFVRDIKLSVTFSSILIALILIFAWILRNNR